MMHKTLIAAELIEPGKAIIIQDGLVRMAIKDVHRADRIAGYSVDTIRKGGAALWDSGRRVLRRKPVKEEE